MIALYLDLKMVLLQSSLMTKFLRMTNFLTHLSEGMKEPRASLVCVLPVPAALSSPDCYGSPFLLCATSIRATGHE